jgi:hypothetical protein
MSIQDLTNLIKAGHGDFHDDPQSGSILKLLGENGFASKITAGATTGHTYTIIHKPPSPEFLLVDVWHDGQSERKAYHAFSVLTRPAAPSTLSTSVERAPEQEHPLITLLRDLNTSADQIIKLSQQYA